MSIQVSTKMYLSELNQLCERDPRDITYLAIGTAPHMTVDQIMKYKKWNHLIPKFMIDYINNTNKTIRIIHFDPKFIEKNNFIKKYFLEYQMKENNLYFIYDMKDGLNMLRTEDNRIEIYLFSRNFDYKNDETTTFLHLMNQLCINYNTQLIVQEYTGYELLELTKHLYNKSSNKDIFMRNILYDVTYGNECHNATNLELYKPLYDENFNFYNLLLYDDDEIKNIIGQNQNVDKILKINYIKKYKKCLAIHTDYRRKVLKLGNIMLKHDRYDNFTDVEEIMNILLEELNKCIIILEKLNVITANKRMLIDILFNKYKQFDLYKWYKYIQLICKNEDITNINLKEIYNELKI